MQRIDFKKKDLHDIETKKGFTTLAIDQSTTKSGYSIFVDGKLDTYGLIVANGDSEKRVFRTVEVFKHLIQETQPDAIALENVQYQSNPKVLILLSKLLGILEFIALDNEIETYIVMPKVWKSTCKIKGRKRKEQKENTVNFIKKEYGIDVSEDIADSISINYHLNKKEVPCKS